MFRIGNYNCFKNSNKFKNKFDVKKKNLIKLSCGDCIHNNGNLCMKFQNNIFYERTKGSCGLHKKYFVKW